MAEGIRWLADHPPMRTLFITIVAFNVTFGAAWSVLVLYAQERLGMDDVGFGLLTTAMAIGGIVGTFDVRPPGAAVLARRHHAGRPADRDRHPPRRSRSRPLPAVALVTFVVFGAHAFVWGTTATAVRQRAVPDELLGRVTGVYHVGVMAGIVVGTPIGGCSPGSSGSRRRSGSGSSARRSSSTVLWRQFDNIVHAGDHVPPRVVAAADS